MTQRVDEYLREHGLASLLDHTKAKAVRHGRYPSLVLLKYNQIDSPMGDPLVQQCRGIIVDEASNWRIVCWPYNKFFNHGEGHAAAIDWSTARVYEKLDGSLMTPYWYGGQWQVASSGSPDASGSVHDHGITFAELFWQTWKMLGYRLPPEEVEGTSLMFELMTPLNRVVVPHSTHRLVLHGARSENGREVSFAELDTLVSIVGCERVQSYPFGNVDEVISAAACASGLEQEGFVVCDAQFNRLKIKGAEYVALHHLRGTLSRRHMLSIVQAGEAPEFLTYFPEMSGLYWDLAAKFAKAVSEATHVYNANANAEDRKTFALAVKDHPYAAACFAAHSGKASIEGWFRCMESRKLARLLGEQDDDA